MSDKIHDFNKSINVGNRGEEIIKSYLENNPNIAEVIDVSKDKRYQDEDIDFIVRLKSGELIPIELKTDTCDNTGNIFYETMSNIEYNVPGCMIKSKAKCLFYYFINTKVLYIIAFKRYKEWVEENCKKFTEKKIKNINRKNNGIAYSAVLLIPRSMLEEEMAGSFKMKILDCA